MGGAPYEVKDPPLQGNGVFRAHFLAAITIDADFFVSSGKGPLCHLHGFHRAVLNTEPAFFTLFRVNNRQAVDPAGQEAVEKNACQTGGKGHGHFKIR